MLISVVIPAYNEINTLPFVITRVEETPYDKEIIIVDDGSTDGTREWLKEQISNFEFRIVPPSAGLNRANLESEDFGDQSKIQGTSLRAPKSKIRVIFHEKNKGKGAAIGAGIRAAKGDIIVIQDADLEYDPRDYPILFAPIIEGKADVVYGSRFSGGAHRVLYFWHYVGNKLITLVSNVFTDLNLTDMETGYKVFKREVLEGIEIKSNRFGFEPEITAKMAKKGCRMFEVPISYYGRSYKEGKKITWKDGIKAVFTIIRYNMFR